jgi:hypothetical protein
MAVIDYDIRTGRRDAPARGTARPGGTAGRRTASAAGTGAQPVAAPIGRLALPVKIYLLAVMLPLAFYVGPIYMTTLRIVVLVMIVPLLVRLFKGHFGRILPTDILFLLYIGWAAVAYVVNHPDSVVQHIGSSGMEFLGGYMIARAYIRTREDFFALCKVLGIMIAVTLPLALYESQTNRPLLIDFVRGLPGLTAPEIIDYEQRMGLYRSQVVFAHPILYGAFCSMGFVLTFMALKGQVSNRRRYWMTALVGACTFLSLSSGAILAVFIQIMFLCWYWAFRKIEWRWMLLLGIFVFMYVVVDLLSDRTPIRVFMSYATFSAHNAFWRGLINEWGMRNIFGSAEHGIPASPWVGIGERDWVRPHFMHSASVDNFWLVTAMRYGVPAFLFLAGGYAFAMWKIARRDFRGDAALEHIRLAWIFTFAGVTFTLITVHVWTALYSFVFFMFGAGMWMYHTTPQTGEDPDAAAAAEAAPPPMSRYTRFPAPGGAPHGERNTA